MSTQFNALYDSLKIKRHLTVSHKTRLERIVALHNHVLGLERELATLMASSNYPYYKRQTLEHRLSTFKPTSFFVDALEQLAAEVQHLN